MDEEEKNDLPDPEALEVGEIEAATDRTLSPTRLLLKRFFRSKLSVAGLIMLIVLFVFSFIGPTLTFLPFIWPEQQSDYSNAVTEENATPGHRDRRRRADVYGVGRRHFRTDQLSRAVVGASARHR